MCSRMPAAAEAADRKSRTGRKLVRSATGRRRSTVSRQGLVLGQLARRRAAEQAMFALEPAPVSHGRRGLSRRHRCRVRSDHRLEEPIHQRPQRAGDTVHRHDRGGLGCRLNGAAGSSAQRCFTTSASSASATPILDKPGKLDETEWAAMRAAATLGDNPVAHRRVRGYRRDRRRPSRAARRQGLSGWSHGRPIALETRIITTADIFDALTADRPYRAAMPVSKALVIMSEMAGSAIDPASPGRVAPRPTPRRPRESLLDRGVRVQGAERSRCRADQGCCFWQQHQC